MEVSLDMKVLVISLKFFDGCYCNVVLMLVLWWFFWMLVVCMF